jgi:hypothetical protein
MQELSLFLLFVPWENCGASTDLRVVLCQDENNGAAR